MIMIRPMDQFKEPVLRETSIESNNQIAVHAHKRDLLAANKREISLSIVVESNRPKMQDKAKSTTLAIDPSNLSASSLQFSLPLSIASFRKANIYLSIYLSLT